MNNEKIEALKTWLTENKVKYQEDVVHAGKGIHIDLYIPKFRIAIHVGDDEDWYHKVKAFVHPVFVRDQDSAEFLIEKVQNTIDLHRLMKKTRKTKSKRELESLPGKRRRHIRRRRNRQYRFGTSLVPASEAVAHTSETIPPEAEQKVKRQRVRITTPVKVGSSHLNK